jgi:hypothetical protein
MFLQIAASGRYGPLNTFLGLPASTIAGILDGVWLARIRGAGLSTVSPMALARGGRRLPIHHLVYALLLENTMLEVVMRRVIWEHLHGERLPTLTDVTTYNWLRTTEQLFYSFGPDYFSGTTISTIRDRPAATRRNAYYRMFGMDLNHGMEDGQPYPYEKPQVANREFVQTFESFLQEVWRGVVNASNSSGENQTDDAAIAGLGRRLQTMLNERRGGAALGPNLAFEEFAAVAALSWLRLLIDSNNNVMNDLKATAASPEERLRKIGDRVGVPVQVHAHSYFRLAPRVSRLLIEIEAGLYSTTPAVQALYFPPGGNPLRDRLVEIIDHWSRVTGRNLKARPMVATAPTPSPTGATRAAGNGSPPRVATATPAAIPVGGA